MAVGCILYSVLSFCVDYTTGLYGVCVCVWHVQYLCFLIQVSCNQLHRLVVNWCVHTVRKTVLFWCFSVNVYVFSCRILTTPVRRTVIVGRDVINSGAVNTAVLGTVAVSTKTTWDGNYVTCVRIASWPELVMESLVVPTCPVPSVDGEVRWQFTLLWCGQDFRTPCVSITQVSEPFEVQWLLYITARFNITISTFGTHIVWCVPNGSQNKQRWLLYTSLWTL